jgi:acetamidase/formamidase
MKTHRYTPTEYRNVLGPAKPVLRIAPGDRVITSTADAHGYDAHQKKTADSPNPMTGPFFIEGAEPGDVLTVRLESLEPNRDSGWTSSMLRPNVVEPLFVKTLPVKEYRTWKLDLQKRTASFIDPHTGVEWVKLAFSPMLGCIGVSPSREQSISTITCGSHGGNMDYRGIVEGVTLFFPVYTEGALLSLGDGHVLQSEGEISGTGIETSFDVQFSVDVVKGKTIAWPRGETVTHLFTMGNARPLETALQHAITEMLRWLENDFGLDIERASLLLGHAGELDVGNIISPDCTMVCKLRKDLL